MHSKYYLILLSLICYEFVNCQVQDSAYSIRGVIIDPELTRPARWAHVYITNKDIETQSDSIGEFVIKGLWADTFFVESDFNGGGAYFDKRGVKVILNEQRKTAYVYLALSSDYYPVPEIKNQDASKWKCMNANDLFTFSIPSMLIKNENIRGIDSYVEQYQSDDMEVGFDYGFNVNFSETIQDSQSKVLVNCKKAIINHFYYPDDKSKYKFTESIDFKSHVTMTLWVNYVSYSQRDEALRILYSIRFP